ncbi:MULTISPECIES: hypothetical protein [Flavobacterium]|uniref:Late embryogenesis abundant protein LEA-2 subgroup domain-containing protein n=1 Tax=Flavobacterium jumunjinense TaxID=998845 RepID=A0ABV5GSB9_9FLAO|nr:MULTISPECIES: hypothetical protein [Flavobacterium]
MKPILKKAILISGVSFAIVGVLAYNKVQKLKRVFEKLEIKPVSVRNLKVSFTAITFTTDILFVNPTSEEFSVSGYVASLKRLNFFYSGKYIATIRPVINEIEIPANNKLLFKNLPVELPSGEILGSIMELTSFDINKLSIEAFIDVAGSEYSIKG